jgi:RNA recognition motif. (a.k.a. RRM, RBD, or RNP domain)
MSEKQFRWRTLGVTPRTVGKNLKNRRKKRHLCEEFFLDSSNTPLKGDISTDEMNLEDVEMEYDNHRAPTSPYNDNRLDAESCSSRIPPVYTLNDSDEVDALSGFRLSLVGLYTLSRGLSSSHSSKSSDDHRDELHSNRYSSVLETVRSTLILCVPQVTEVMISRAIIKAFADSSVDGRIRSSFESEVEYQRKYQDEADLFCEAFEFVQSRQNQTNEKYQKDIKQFLQSILDETFLKIRHEEITSSNEVLQTMLSIMSILGLKVDESINIPVDTIILQGLPNSTSRNDLLLKLSPFGKIKSVAIAARNSSFGLCCFYEYSSVRNAVEKQHEMQIVGVSPTISALPLSITGEHRCIQSGKFANHLKSERILWSI